MIGERIRTRRNEVGMSLRDLGSLTNLSASFLSQVENNHVAPSLSSLQRISTALALPMFKLLNEDADGSPVVRLQQRRKLQIQDWYIGYDLLTPPSQQAFMSVLIRMEPGGRRQAEKLARPTEEWMFVLQGCFEVVLSQERFLLNAGDSVAYTGEDLREFGVVGDEQALVICVVAPPVL
jgi:transcriptional regulator with XRE-family HTH domain